MDYPSSWSLRQEGHPRPEGGHERKIVFLILILILILIVIVIEKQLATDETGEQIDGGRICCRL